jgi:predicted HicB family RNase H-like nuclease
MHTINLKIDDQQHETLREMAFRARVSVASLVRKALTDFLTVETLNDLPKEE